MSGIPKISVIVPVYNMEKYLRECLDSVIHQTLSDIEIILIDDGSKDESSTIIDEYASSDLRIIPIHKANAGVSEARNDGLRIAQGQYVFLCDSDDWMELDALEKLWNTAEQTQADIIYSDYYQYNSDKQTYKQLFPKEFTTKNKETVEILQRLVFYNRCPQGIVRPEFSDAFGIGGAPWHALISRSIIKDHDLRFDPYVRGVADDVLFMLHVYEYVQKVAYIKVPTYNYRIIGNSLTRGFKPQFEELFDRIFERFEEFIVSYRKDEAFRGASRVRVLFYLNETFKMYFMNPKNPEEERKRYLEFKRLVKKEPYNAAIMYAPLNTIASKRWRYSVWLLRLRLYKIFWMLKKRSFKKL